MGTSYEPGSISGYLAKPSGSGPWPRLFVIQEWWDLDFQTKSIANLTSHSSVYATRLRGAALAITRSACPLNRIAPHEVL